jgi:hemolysin activation/secretion protein
VKARRRGGRTPLRLAFTALIAGTSQLLAAQPAGAPQQPGDRTGPEAAPPPLPPFPAPEELRPNLVPQAPGTSAVPDAPVASTFIRQVRVAADGDGTDAVPPRRWRPPVDGPGGLTLTHRPGQPLDPDWVRAQFSANLGSGGSVATAVALVQLINRGFLTAGFVNSGIVVPEQRDLASGTLDLRVIYGRLAAAAEAAPVTVQWAESGPGGLSEAYVRSRFPSIRAQPLSALDIERDFRLLAEDPGIRTVNAELRPGARPGEASLYLTIHPEERFDLYLGLANDRSPSVGGERVYAGGYVRNLLAPGDLLTAEAGLTEGVEDASLAYSVPLLPRTYVSVRGSYNDAAVVDRPLIPLDIRAEDRSFQAGLSHRFLQEPLSPAATPGRWSASRSFTLGAYVAWREQRSFLLGEPFSFAPGSVEGRTEYTALRLTADYLARGVAQVFAVSVTGTQGLGGTQSNVPGIPNPQDDFRALLAQFNYARRLNSSGLEVRARITGQLADGVLYSGERLSIGGETSVRGYRENLYLVDTGAIGSIELAHPLIFGEPSGDGDLHWGRFMASVFADAATFENVDSPDPDQDFIASAGIALSWNPSEAISASVAFGVPLVDVPLSGGRDLQDRGFHFRIVVHPLRLFRRR